MDMKPLYNVYKCLEHSRCSKKYSGVMGGGKGEMLVKGYKLSVIR